jgi:hypothetical protein
MSRRTPRPIRPPHLLPPSPDHPHCCPPTRPLHGTFCASSAVQPQSEAAEAETHIMPPHLERECVGWGGYSSRVSNSQVDRSLNFSLKLLILGSFFMLELVQMGYSGKCSDPQPCRSGQRLCVRHQRQVERPLQLPSLYHRATRRWVGSPGPDTNV